VGAATALVAGQSRQDLGKELEKKRRDLLITYATFKDYPNKDPDYVYGRMSASRQAVFDSIVRALFIELEDADGEPLGKRIAQYLSEVRGIWGVRPGNTEGRFQFRVSVVWGAGLRDALDASSNIPRSVSGHVIKPVKDGGDDRDDFDGFVVVDDGVVTYRQASLSPRLQVNYLRRDETVGEVDIDFDNGCFLWWSCHCRPSNSDVGSVRDTEHQHLRMFNSQYNFFDSALSTMWKDDRHHCRASY